MTNFVSNHKRLIIGIGLYIAVFIVSIFVSPWSLGELGINEVIDVSESVVTDKIPVNVIFFGIYELIELMDYSLSDALGEGGDILFFVAACAMFSFAKLINKFVIQDDFDDFPESLVLDFLYDNIFAYVACLITYFAYPPVRGIVNNVFDGDTFWLKAVVVVALAIVVFVPSLLNISQVIVYALSVSAILELLSLIERSLNWYIIVEAVIAFTIAAVLLVVVNLIVNMLMDKMLDKLLEFLKDSFGLIFGLIIDGIKVVVIIVAVVFALALILTLLSPN